MEVVIRKEHKRTSGVWQCLFFDLGSEYTGVCFVINLSAACFMYFSVYVTNKIIFFKKA